MFDLVVQSGKLEGKRLLLPLEKDIVIGREPGCQIVLTSTRISRRHCRLRRTEQGVQVQDLGSQNGTFVNDVVITAETLLTTGDTLRVGATVFEIQPHHKRESPASPKPAPPKPFDEVSGMTTVVGLCSAGLSDYEIITWLSDHELASSDSSQDGLVSRIERLVPPKPLSATPVSPTMTASADSQHTRSYADEAAEIIRRHWAQRRDPSGRSGGK